jgi:hypothetical protein
MTLTGIAGGKEAKRIAVELGANSFWGDLGCATELIERADDISDVRKSQ